MNKSRITKLLSLILLPILLLASQNYSSAEEKKLYGSLSLGYNQYSGNTEYSYFYVSGWLKRFFTDAELYNNVEIYTTASDSKTDSQYWYNILKYTRDFGQNKRWYKNFQLETDHDRFADIDFRITPAIGIGHWFYKEDDLKWSAEASTGYEITNYRSSRSDDESVVLIFNSYFEKKIFKNSYIYEDLTVTPSIEGEGTRIKSKSTFTTAINDSVDLFIKFTVDYNSDPSPGKKDTDTRLVTGITFSF